MQLENSLHGIRFVILCMLSLFLLLICTLIQIDNFDAYNLLLNAKAIAKTGGSYSIYRSIVASLLYTPAFLVEKYFVLPGLGFRLAHLLNAGLFLLILGASYRLFRLSLSKKEALCGVYTLALTPMIIHYVPIAKEDFPATLFLTTAFYFYLKAFEKRQNVNWAISGFFTALAMGARYNLIPVLFAIFFSHEIYQWLRLRTLRNSKEKILFLFLLPSLIWILLPIGVYPIVGHAVGIKAVLLFVQELFEQYRTNLHVYRAPFYNYLFLYKAISGPILLLALFGLLGVIKHPRKHAPFFLIWFSVFFLFQTYFVSGKEVRYLFPGFPPVFYFFVCGLSTLNRFKLPGALSSLFLIGLSLIWPAYRAAIECNKFRDRFYTTAFQKNVSLEAKRLSGDSNSLIWVGHYYGTHPKQYVFDTNEDFTYLYHFYVNSILFYTGKTPLTLSGAPPLIPPDWQTKGVWLPGIGSQINSGDVFLINLEKTVSRTSIVPNPLPPLIMQQAEKISIASSESPTMGKSYELYVPKDSQFVSLGILNLGSSSDFKKLKRQLPKGSYLLSFKNVKLFEVPSS